MLCRRRLSLCYILCYDCACLLVGGDKTDVALTGVELELGAVGRIEGEHTVRAALFPGYVLICAVRVINAAAACQIHVNASGGVAHERDRAVENNNILDRHLLAVRVGHRRAVDVVEIEPVLRRISK